MGPSEKKKKTTAKSTLGGLTAMQNYLNKLTNIFFIFRQLTLDIFALVSTSSFVVLGYLPNII